MNKILIEIVTQTENEPELDEKRMVVQADIFGLTLRITNICEEESCGFSLKELKFSGVKIEQRLDDSFYVEPLGANESKDIFLGKFGTYLNGITTIHSVVVSDVEDEVIRTFQKDVFTGAVSSQFFENKWQDSFYVQTRVEHTQQITNERILFLTATTVLITIFSFF